MIEGIGNTLTMGGLFLEGLLSFFSPCVLPLVPLYIGYLTSDAKTVDEEGNVTYKRGRVMALTAAFVLGICMVFVIAGLASDVLRRFFLSHEYMFQIIGGIVLLLFGLVCMDVIQIPLLSSTHMKQMDVTGKMSLLKAWLMGFLFSFAWSPCVGPMLGQAIVLAADSESKLTGWMYIGSYGLGFILIFILLGLFTREILELLKKYRGVVKYTGLIAGLVVVLAGFWMLYQGFSSVSSLTSTSTEISNETESKEESDTDTDTDSDTVTVDDLDIALKDINGNVISMKDYEGKIVILDFFGTWCYYCNEELPHLKSLQESRDDVKIILVAAPGVNGEGDAAYVEEYLAKAGYSFTVVYDTELTATYAYGVSGYPTTYIVKKDGSYLGYLGGYVDEETLLEVIAQADEN